MSNDPFRAAVRAAKLPLVGLNADWCVDAAPLNGQTIAAGLFVVDDEDGTAAVVWRTPREDNDEIVTLDRAPLEQTSTLIGRWRS